MTEPKPDLLAMAREHERMADKAAGEAALAREAGDNADFDDREQAEHAVRARALRLLDAVEKGVSEATNEQASWVRTRDALIARLCSVQAAVVRQLFEYDQPNDCFCWDGHRGRMDFFSREPELFRSSGQGVAFIEVAIHAVLAALLKQAEKEGT